MHQGPGRNTGPSGRLNSGATPCLLIHWLKQRRDWKGLDVYLFLAFLFVCFRGEGKKHISLVFLLQPSPSPMSFKVRIGSNSKQLHSEMNKMKQQVEARWNYIYP